MYMRTLYIHLSPNNFNRFHYRRFFQTIQYLTNAIRHTVYCYHFKAMIRS